MALQYGRLEPIYSFYKYKAVRDVFFLLKSLFFSKKLLARAVEPKFKISRTLGELQDAHFF